MLVTKPALTVAEFEAGTGWELKPEGACLGDLCVPLHDEDVLPGGEINLATLPARLGMAHISHDAALAALGPASINGRQLQSVTAPDLTLPDFEGNDFRLSSLRGQKVVLVAWAPY